MFVVKGKATCHKKDKYDKEFGKKLAEIRAKEKMIRVAKDLMVQETYRPEWRKKHKKVVFKGRCEDLLSFKCRILNSLDSMANHKDYGKVKVSIERI